MRANHKQIDLCAEFEFFGLWLSAIYRGVLPGKRAYPSGVGHNSHRKALVTADRRLSFFCFLQLISQCLVAHLNVRFWHKADIYTASQNVRYWG